MSGTERQGVGARDLEFDLNWRCTVHTRQDIHEFRLLSTYRQYDDPDAATLVHDLIWTTPFPDDRTEWHRNYTSLPRWVRGHIYRLPKGWTHQRLHDHLNKNSLVAQSLGFNDDQRILEAPDPPSYTQLRDIWEETFTDRTRAACEVIADELVQLARDNGISVPAEVLQPKSAIEAEDDDPDEDDATVRELTIEKSHDVWEHIRPIVLDHWYLNCHHNWQILEHQFVQTAASDCGNVDAERLRGPRRWRPRHVRPSVPRGPRARRFH